MGTHLNQVAGKAERDLAQSLLNDSQYQKRDGTPNFAKIAEQVGVSDKTVARWYRDKIEPEVELPDFVSGDPEEPIQDIIDRQKKRFRHGDEAAQARKWYEVKIKEFKPYGLLMFGDPHVDDNGCNWPMLERHIEVAKKPGVYGLNKGDTTNNWVGRLMAKYADQDTSNHTAKRLAEWFMFDSGVTWVCWLLGNHDMWNGGGDFYKRMGKHKVPVLDWQAQFKLVSSNGSECRIDAAHGRKGSSIWNNLHATLRAAKLGELADIYVTGHTHHYGLEHLEIPERSHSCWLAQLRGYKFQDDYALTHGFAESQLGCSILAVIDPSKEARHRVHCFEDVEEGAEFLEWKRSK